MTEFLTVAKNLRKHFVQKDSQLEVLKGVDLSLKHGEMVGVVGASGAGKSTLLHLLGTLDVPSDGQIFYEDKDITSLSSKEMARFRNQTIGFVFQFHHLLPEFTALENVMMPGLIWNDPKGPLQRRAKDLLGEVGLTSRLEHRPGELSGGEQQRVALARALIMNPKIILADEPTGNLDSKTSQAVHEIFFDLNQNLGTTFLIVTHSPELAKLMPRRLTMRDGKVVDDTQKSTSPISTTTPAKSESAL